jgi:hypothetical protein
VLVVLPTLNLAGWVRPLAHPTAGYGSVPALRSREAELRVGPARAQGALTRGAGAVERRTTNSVGRT